MGGLLCQTDRLEMSVQQALQVLAIKQQDKKDIQKIKERYKKNMLLTASNPKRAQRNRYNEAYFILSQNYFNKKEENYKFIYSIITGKTEEVKQALQKDLKLLKYRTTGDQYPILYHAVRSGHYDIVQLILKMGCSIDFSQDQSTPMHCAAHYGHFTIIPLLLHYGISTNLKNKFNNLPIHQAANDEIKQLLSNTSQDSVHELIQKLTLKKLSITVLNINKDSETVIKKIVLANYYQQKFTDFIDAFHGTSFKKLQSIAQNGLKVPDGKQITVVQGHINLGVQYLGIKDWSRAIFLSPSIYYAAHPVYAKQHINKSTEVWLPIIQAKVKKGSYTEHPHTLNQYRVSTSEPKTLQLRVQSVLKSEDTEPKLIMRSQTLQDIIPITIMLIKKSFLKENQNYETTTKLVLNSPEQQYFRKHHCSIFI